jgi:ATP/maltotriose-dependent transcriptional regulator MalT
MSKAFACEAPRESGDHGFASLRVWKPADICASQGLRASRSVMACVRLEIARAWQMLICIQSFDVEALAIAQRIEQRLSASSDSVAMGARSEIAALKAVAFALRDNGEAALAAALSALRLGAPTPSAQVALTVCRWVYWRLGDLERFYAVEPGEYRVRPRRLSAVTAVFDLTLHAAVELSQMRFHSARLLVNDAFELARRCVGNAIPIDAFPACVMAQLKYEEGHVDEAEALVVARLPNIRQGGTIEGAVWGYGLLARIAMNRRRPEQALALLAEADALAVKRDWPRLHAASLAQLVEVHVAAGHFDQATSCARLLGTLVEQCDSGSMRFELTRYHLLAQARLALVRSSDTVDLASLRQLHVDADLRRDRYAAVTILLLLIESLLAVDRCDEAAKVLAMLLRQAAEAGLHQTLVDCSECIAQLINAIVLGERAAVEDVRELLPYARTLMTRRRRSAVPEAVKCDAVPDNVRQASTAGLSERERVIIGLMGGGLTNKQIAIRLRIAPETVKSYAKHLYTKLGARNRTEAAMLASRLGLIRLSGSDVG